jgi:cardiolipin synthase
MAQAGVEIRRYHALHWYTLDRLNNRTHRKILVADGASASPAAWASPTNGAGNAQDKEHWRDTHFRIEGPVVGPPAGGVPRQSGSR